MSSSPPHMCSICTSPDPGMRVDAIVRRVPGGVEKTSQIVVDARMGRRRCFPKLILLSQSSKTEKY